MAEPDTDILIVGGGVAGLLLAWKLGKARVRVLQGRFPPASVVAAGVLNPVTGRRLARVPDFEAFFDEAAATYTGIPARTETFRKTKIRRYFLNQKEADGFEERKDAKEFRNYLAHRLPPGKSTLPIADPLGSFEIAGAAVVDLQPVFEAIHARLNGRIREEDADWDSLECREDRFRLNGISARILVCCEGASVIRNPLFRWLPFRPVAGETLTVRMDGVPDFPEVVQHGKWVLSLGDGRFRIGSTYEKIDLGGEGLRARNELKVPRKSPEARAALLEAIREIFPEAANLEVLDQRAGIRPASRDRIPYLGPHPELPNAFVCNGLGSKGTLYAPLLCETLANHLTTGAPLPGKWLPQRMIRRGFSPKQAR